VDRSEQQTAALSEAAAAQETRPTPANCQYD